VARGLGKLQLLTHYRFQNRSREPLRVTACAALGVPTNFPIKSWLNLISMLVGISFEQQDKFSRCEIYSGFFGETPNRTSIV
jgi:hypothetical protein